MHSLLINAFSESIEAKRRMRDDIQLLETIQSMASKIWTMYEYGGELLIAGNGGSMSDALHFAGEIESQFMEKRKARPATVLGANVSALTAWSNDVGYETALERFLEARLDPKNILFLISTSGNSKNQVHLARRARDAGIKVFGLLGRDGGELVKQGLCDMSVIVPSSETPRIQECHITVIHIICEIIDLWFADTDKHGQ